MYVYGSWAIDSLNTDGVNYGVVTIPSFAGQEKSKSILSSSGVSISKDCKNKEAAWEFVKFWTSEEMNKERIGLELPVLYSVVEAEGIMEQPEYAPFYTMLEQSEGTTPASFLIESWPELKDTLSLSFERIFNPSSMEDPKTVLDEAAMQ
jgi:multiple sugar transport system substrate-binding protein